MVDFQDERYKMIREQLVRRGIVDRGILNAMSLVPRELFVPVNLREAAYADRALPIEKKQTISQPYIVALMLEAADVMPSDRVLEIGSGSGYLTAVLSHLINRVYAVERHEHLVQLAGKRFTELGCANIEMKCDDGTFGWAEHAPFDAILVSAGAPEVPESLIKQLDIGGRLVMPIGKTPARQALIRVYRMTETNYLREDLGEVQFVPLIGEGNRNWHELEEELDQPIWEGS